MKLRYILPWLFLTIAPFALAQNYSRTDSLKGSVGPARAWWDLLHYNIQVDVDPDKQFIKGYNILKYKVLEPSKTMQIDLQSPMKIQRVVHHDQELAIRSEGNAHFVELKQLPDKGALDSIRIEFSGTPIPSTNPPWDGGFIWTKDQNGNDLIANANQLIGVSSWLPSKDHPYDEPDEGITTAIIAPSNLKAISNGVLVSNQDIGENKNKTTWKVVNPINAYGINISLGNYRYFNEVYNGLKGPLDCHYYVIEYNLAKAKEHFKQVPMMLEALEHWFGPYPFYEDGYKIIEVPYLGMEHQSAVTYGNEFRNGYRGGDLSLTGWGLKFDFIIVHESGHEWFANSITNSDVADMWIHEGFTTYSEVLYLDYHFGTQAGNEYLIGYRDHTKNDRPIIGEYEVDQRGSGDMYIKAASMIHMIRQLYEDDDKFRDLLLKINNTYYHKNVSSAEIEDFIATHLGKDLSKVFDQYLRTIKIPELQVRSKKGKLNYRYRNVVEGFNMPVRVIIDGEPKWLKPGTVWQVLEGFNSDAELKIDPNFFVKFNN